MGTTHLASAARRNHWNSHLERHAFATPEGAALRFEGRTTTWQELGQRVEALAGALARRGVTPGSRVAILMTNRPEFVESVLAATRLGAIAVPVNFRLTGPEIAFILDDAEAAPLLVDAHTRDAGIRAAQAASGPVNLVVVGADPEVGESYEALLAETGEEPPAIDVSEDAPALLMYTSGTTGRPKGAVLSHQNLQGQALTIIRAWQLTRDGEVNLVAAPLFHIASIGSLVAMLLIGARTVILPSGAFDPSGVLDVLEQERITSVFLVPAQWQAVCAQPDVGSRDLRALRVMGWGAAPASATLLTRMAEVFPTTLNTALFGQTEMSPVTCVLDGVDALRKIGSVGKAVATVAIRVVDDEMRDVAVGEVGEIVYRGPTVMQGYWHNPEANELAFRGGWFHSGDLVRVDDEGFVYVVDRLKDMIISGGENVYCVEVEDAVAAHPAVAEVSVYGRAHRRWVETPVAAVVLRPGATLDIEELRTWASERLARYKLPTVLEVHNVLPRNASGKVLKHELRAAAEADEA